MGIFADKDALARIQAATDYPLQRTADGRVVGHFFHCRLSSVFQPVFDISERQVAGHAAYVRSDANDDGALSPWGIFALAAEDPVLVRLDRLSRAETAALVDAIHRFGATLLVRDVETEQEMTAAVRAGADLLQGRFLGEAARGIESIARRAQEQGSHPGYAW